MKISTFWALALGGLVAAGSPRLCAQADTVIYKRIGEVALPMIVRGHRPAVDSLRPAALFFFGGGWVGGNPGHFVPQADYLAERGMIAFLADYRTRSRHGTDPFAALRDAKSAVRWLKQHGTAYGVDTARIVLGGGSAGGHLAIAATVVPGFDDPADDPAVSLAVAGLLLFNPVVDNGPAGYGYERIGAAYKDFSPLHNLDQDVPPTLFLVGDEDHLIPVETARYFARSLTTLGVPCDLRVYPGGKHGFFNSPNPYFHRQTLLAMDEFLVGLGFLKKL